MNRQTLTFLLCSIFLTQTACPSPQQNNTTPTQMDMSSRDATSMDEKDIQDMLTDTTDAQDDVQTMDTPQDTTTSDMEKDTSSMDMVPDMPAQKCGNDVREGDEECDGMDFGTESCQTQGFEGDTLSCNDDCKIVTSSCACRWTKEPIVTFMGEGSTSLTDSKWLAVDVDKNNKIHVAYMGSGSKIHYATKDEQGMWQSTSIHSMPEERALRSGGVGIGVDSNGVVWIACTLSDPNRAVILNNATMSWEVVHTISQGFTEARVGLDVDDMDNVHVAYSVGIPGLSSRSRVDYISKSPSAMDWEKKTFYESTRTAYHGDIDIEAPSPDSVHISFRDSQAISSYLGYYSNASGEWQSLRILGDGGNGSHYGEMNAVTTDASRRVFLTSRHTRSKKLLFSTNKTNQYTSHIVDESGDAAYHSSIGVDTKGGVHILYFDNLFKNLKYARNEGDFDTWKTEMLDDMGSNGRFTDMKMHGDDIHGVYLRSTPNGEIMYIHRACPEGM